jgi:hypothetical protein
MCLPVRLCSGMTSFRLGSGRTGDQFLGRNGPCSNRARGTLAYTLTHNDINGWHLIVDLLKNTYDKLHIESH